MIREGRVSGSTGEKLLLVTGRLAWSRVLAVGVGASADFSQSSCQAALECALDAARGIGATHMAIALPGRDIDLVRPDLAMYCLLDTIEKSRSAHGSWLSALTIIDVPTAAKAMDDCSRSVLLSSGSEHDIA
jgi:hypothetical protein